MKKIMFALIAMLAPTMAFAQEAVASGAVSSDRGLVALSAAFAIGVSVFGGAMAQSKAAASALEGIARNPAASGKILIPMILGLALIESLVIYALIIALKLS